MSSRHHKSGLSTAYPRELPPRRFTITFALVAIFVILCLAIISSFVPSTSEDAAQHIHTSSLPKLSVPSIHNPFRQTAHKPPEQHNSTSGEAKWFSDWKWMNPFSSSITLDEDRSVLPSLMTRPPIYTFYDTSAEKDDETRAAEYKLLLTWRRAWWAQGFRPVILGRAEAMNNPLYESLQTKKMEHVVEAELIRWLAWGHMGTGILANWLVVPMGSHDDDLLSFLRRGAFPELARYETLGSGLFSGDKASINGALTQALNSKDLEIAKTFLETIDPNAFFVNPKPTAIAFYDSPTISSKYKPVSSVLVENRTEGLLSLSNLITSHLQLNFLNIFSSGLAILNPYPLESTILTHAALSIAFTLTHCPPTPDPESCPPNLPNCYPCSPKTPLSITTPPSFPNTTTTTLYTIGTIPHPYTLAILLAKNPEITTRHIRRETARDPWLLAMTEHTLGKDIAGPSRIVSFKESVASPSGSARNLWLTEDATALSRRDLEWHFGFSLARNATEDDADARATAFQRALKASGGATEDKLDLQLELVAKAKEVLDKEKGVREMVEAWNLADTEAWRFVRAFGARGVVERVKWEDEERRFGGGEEARGEGWGRWFDRLG
ncbi:hypothetical protein MMC12_007901 [Toensbergia leucococca]|nr:hypothetical protein [Toensbergia leucococca]